MTTPHDHAPDTSTDDTTTSDPRTLAEERLAHLSSLQMRMQRRGGPDRGPWHAGRGGQGRVLALVAMNPEISQRELTFLLGMSRQALAELLGKLEHKGFITRAQSDADRRVVLVTLTEAGQEAAKRIEEHMQHPSTMLDSLSDDEVANLADYLGRIIETVETRIEERREERHRYREEQRASGDHDNDYGRRGGGCGNRTGRGPGHRHHHYGRDYGNHRGRDAHLT